MSTNTAVGRPGTKMPTMPTASDATARPSSSHRTGQGGQARTRRAVSIAAPGRSAGGSAGDGSGDIYQSTVCAIASALCLSRGRNSSAWSTRIRATGAWTASAATTRDSASLTGTARQQMPVRYSSLSIA